MTRPERPPVWGETGCERGEEPGPLFSTPSVLQVTRTVGERFHLVSDAVSQASFSVINIPSSFGTPNMQSRH